VQLNFVLTSDGGLSMGNQLSATARGNELAQIERDWTMAQARIDALAESGKQAIQRLLHDTIQRAELASATLGERTDVQANPDPGSCDIDHLAEAV
jgi:hypothetical protein